MSRSLAIESTGDFHAGRIKPKIRLSGLWLAKAGFTAGKRVNVEVLAENQMLVIRLEAPTEVAP